MEGYLLAEPNPGEARDPGFMVLRRKQWNREAQDLPRDRRRLLPLLAKRGEGWGEEIVISKKKVQVARNDKEHISRACRQ